MSNSQEVEDQSYRRLAAHYEALWKREQHEHLWYQAKLFDAWKTMAGQTRGLQRQRRIINRLRAELAEIKSAQAKAGIVSGDDARRLEEAMRRNELRAGIRSGSTGDPNL